MTKFLLKNKSGSALLVALLIMGVFLAISLILSSLILRETRITISFINAGQAYYSAESGIEIGLYGLNTELPGWEPEYGNDGFKSFRIDDGEDFKALGQYKLKNRCRAYPCFDEDEYDVGSLAVVPKYFYDVLALNQSITIPLFVAEEEGGVTTIKDTKDFVVEFFTPLNPQKHLKFENKEKLSGWDVLRWKIVGVRAAGDEGDGQTETISDFTAASMLKVSAETEPDKIITSNATVPSWFGSITDCNKIADRYFDGIDCAPFYLVGKYGSESIILPGEIAKTQVQNCLPWQAREFSVYDYFGGDKTFSKSQGCYPIADFLNNHTLNYLVLTNLVNPAVFIDGVDKDVLSRLFFRVELGEVNAAEVLDEGSGDSAYTVAPVASITANGYSGDSKQSINVKIQRGSFMPVFNFSLYSTYMEDPCKDWYEDSECVE